MTLQTVMWIEVTVKTVIMQKFILRKNLCYAKIMLRFVFFSTHTNLFHCQF